jgi:hypothetical protein
MTTATEWLAVEVLHKTARAVLVSNGKDQAWLPLASIIDSEDDLVIGAHTRIEISGRLADEKGLT